MDEEIIVYPVDGDQILDPVTLPEQELSENNDAAASDPALVEEQKEELSENIANKIIETLQDSVSENPQSNEIREIDYSQQLSNIYNAIGVLHDDFNSLSVSLNEIQESIVSVPEDTRNVFQVEIDFHYITMSLYVGLLVVLLFFMGLKK